MGMTPYYDDEGITIYHGDCREVLPMLDPVDLVLTDPPYGIGLEYGDAFDDSEDYLARVIADAIPQCVELAPATLLTCGASNIHKYPPPTWVLAWFIPAGSGASPWGFGTWQPILAYGKDPYLTQGLGRRADSITRGNQGARVAIEREMWGHPCPKPLPAWKQIMLRGSAREGDTILDPFMGSGTTMRAAKDLGRRAIGIEIEERYCEVAANRLTQGVLDFGGAA
jgi:hypothetical protein